MKIFTVSDFKDVFIFIDNREYQRAYDFLFEAHTYLKNVLHQESAHVMYYMAYCQDYLNNPYGAIEWLNQALEIDNCNYVYASFRTSVLSEIEESIDPLIPYGIEKYGEVEKIYNFLLKEGYVRSNVQFLMIRFYIKINELSVAKKMLENFIERNPNDEEASFMYANLNSFSLSTSKKDARTKLKTA